MPPQVEGETLSLHPIPTQQGIDRRRLATEGLIELLGITLIPLGEYLTTEASCRLTTEDTLLL